MALLSTEIGSGLGIESLEKRLLTEAYSGVFVDLPVAQTTSLKVALKYINTVMLRAAPSESDSSARHLPYDLEAAFLPLIASNIKYVVVTLRNVEGLDGIFLSDLLDVLR